MTVEAPKQLSPTESFRLISTVTLVSASIMAAGIYGMTRQGEDEQSLRCRTLQLEANNLQELLHRSGTLAVEGVILPSLDIRNPLDPILVEWGRVKNKRDRECAISQKQFSKTFDPITRAGALLGGVVTLLGVQAMTRSWSRLKTSS